MRQPDRAAAERAIEDFLRALGHDPEAEPELRQTKSRVAAAFLDQLCVGYTQDPKGPLQKHLLEGVTGDVIVRGIPVLTMCPHHLMLATGEATVGFSATGRGVGLGAIADVVRICSRRLILQEVLGKDVCDAIHAVLAPSWVFCRVTLAHGCMRVADESLLHTTVETVATRGDVPAAVVGPEKGARP